MAVNKVPATHTYARNAGADLSGKLHYLAKVDTDGDLILTAARTDTAIGVIYEAAAEGKLVTVQFGGIGKVVAGEAIAAGDRLCPGTDGRALDADTTNDVVFGVALSEADENDVFSFVFARGHV